MTEKTPAQEPQSEPDAPKVEDLRGQQTTRHDQSAHRRHTWLYEDLLN